MNHHVSNLADTLIQFPNSGGPDPLDGTGQNVVGLIQRAAITAQGNSQHVLDICHKLQLQLRGAEDRIRELEENILLYKERANRAEKWLHKISLEIEQRFFASNDGRSQPAPIRQTDAQDYAPRAIRRSA